MANTTAKTTEQQSNALSANGHAVVNGAYPLTPVERGGLCDAKSYSIY